MRSVFAVTVSLMFFVGCERDYLPEDIAAEIVDACDFFPANGMAKRSDELFNDLHMKICALESKAARTACVMYWKDCLMQIRPQELTPDKRGRLLCEMLNFHGVRGLVNLYGAAGASRDEQLDLLIELLSRMRRHISTLQHDIEELTCKARTGLADNGIDSLTCMNAIGGYDSIAWSYENYILLLEYHRFDSVTKDLATELRNRMRQKFEAFLGRPMRTVDECRRDHRNRKAVEFPRMDPLGRSKDASMRIAGKKSELEKEIPNVEVEIEFQKGE